SGNGRPTVATIDLDALAFNFHSSKRFIGEDIRYLAVVKANAYGHGAVACARRLESEGVDWFGVALVEEGVELRNAGITKPILVLGGFWSGQENDVIDRDLTPAISTINQLELLETAAAARSENINVHIKIDTGMMRIGVRWTEFDEFAARVSTCEHLTVEGVMTHFAAADDLAETSFTDEQMQRFDLCVSKLRSLGIEPEIIDLANSPGAVGHPKARRQMVRLGGILYGLGGDVLAKEIDKPELRPVMSLRSKVAMLKQVQAGETIGYGRSFKTDRDTTIAVIPIGYADGLPRSLSSNGSMLIRGHIAPILGRVSMDWTVIDVSEIEGVLAGDEVTLLGTDGDHRILAENIAAITNTISYEITCGIGPRVSRLVIGGTK
ncbi:MAG TPA: alanine racemase, partial [Pyrinomonadaceae bacterium]|nr:alanine racemase [Pyrinomonadaceae bacterium]